MYTQCPHCQTIFGVSEAHLSAAYGRVRCGHCRGQFNAKRHMLDKLPEPPAPKEAPPAPIEEPKLADAPAGHEEVNLPFTDEVEADDVTYIDLSSPSKQAEEHSEPVPIESAMDITTTGPESVELSIEPLPEMTSAKPKDSDSYLFENGPPEAFEPSSQGTGKPADKPSVKAPPSRPKGKQAAKNAELDAIFAELDNRLEKLSGQSDDDILQPNEEFETHTSGNKDYADAFGDPDNQTEDDIRLSIETIFAAAEEELTRAGVKPESGNKAAANTELELTPLDLNMALDPGHLDMASQEEPVVEDVFIAEQEQTQDLPELEEVLVPTDAPAYVQEELPFALHDDRDDEAPAPRGWFKTLALGSLALLLLLGIGFQLALFRNVELANKLPALKPYLVQFCERLPCQFTGQRDVKRIYLTSRDVRTHPEGKNTILINAIFVNNAEFEQPYPDILITLSDLTTTVLAQRRFTPQDYLAKTNAFHLMKPGKPVYITLEVLDPGNDAVNFQFDFL